MTDNFPEHDKLPMLIIWHLLIKHFVTSFSIKWFEWINNLDTRKIQIEVHTRKMGLFPIIARYMFHSEKSMLGLKTTERNNDICQRQHYCHYTYTSLNWYAKKLAASISFLTILSILWYYQISMNVELFHRWILIVHTNHNNYIT